MCSVPFDGTDDDNDYTAGSRFTLSVTDANKATTEKTLYVLANRDPLPDGGVGNGTFTTAM